MSNQYRGASFSGGNTANLTVGTGFEPSRPVGPGKGPIRTAMANDSFNYTLKDRMAARRADKAMAGTGNVGFSGAAGSNVGFTGAPAGVKPTGNVGFSGAAGSKPTRDPNSYKLMPDGSRMGTALAWEGSPTPAQNMQPAKSPLDTSPTPRLDAQQQSQKRETFAEADVRTRREKTLSGAFGERAQKKEENLQGRKALYRDMQTVGGANISGSMRAQANQLGVPQSRFDQVAGTLPAAPAMIAKPGAPTLAGKYGFAKGSATAAAPTPAAPLTGSALAQKNIAEKGIQGAAADYFQRRDNEMLTKQQKQIDTAMGKPVEYAGAPAAKIGVRSPVATSKPAKVAYRNPMAAPAATAPTMTMGSTPKQPVSVAQPDTEDYGGNVVMNTPPAKSMGYNKDAVDKVRGTTNKIDAAMNSAASGVGNQISGAFRKSVDTMGKVGSAIAAAPAKARAFSDRTNAATSRFSSQLQSSLGISSPSTPSWKTPPPLTADIGKADVMPNKRTTRNY